MKWDLKTPIFFEDYNWKDFFIKIEKSVAEAYKKIPQLSLIEDDLLFLKTLLNFFDEPSKWAQLMAALAELKAPDTELSSVNLISEKSGKLRLKLAQSVYLNPAVWQRFKEIKEHKLHGEDLRLYKDLKNCFCELGVHLTKSQQKRLLAIDNRISKIENKIQTNLRKEVKKTPLVIRDKRELKGISEELCKQFYVKRRKEWVFMLDDGVYSELIDNAESENIRKNTVLISRGLGNNENEYNNSLLIEEIASLRREKSQLLGYQNHIEYSLQDSMIKTESEVRRFLNEIDKKLLPKSKKELSIYKKFIPEKKIKIWNKFYFKNKMLKNNFSISPEELRQYFPLAKVWRGLLLFIEKAFLVEFREENLPRYAENVKSYSCWDKESNKQLGVLYLDLFSREGKSPGAWMQDLVDPGDKQFPWIVLAMNINKTENVFLSLYEVKTLFHEMGHCLHGLLSKAKYSCFSGTYVAQDFVELPSQFMENLVFLPEVIDLISEHAVTKKTLPSKVVKLLREYDNYQVASELLQDVGHCYLDLELHGSKPQSLIKIQEKCYEKRNLFFEPKGLSKITHFTHILCGQYSAGYYSYLWSEILDSDCFEQVLTSKGRLNYHQLIRYKEEILKVGSSRDEMQSFVAFTGRKPKINAFLKKRQIIT